VAANPPPRVMRRLRRRFRNLYLQVSRDCEKMVKYLANEGTVGKTSFKGETQNEKTTAHVHMRGICGELCSMWTEQRNC
jgi:hypothetical protein